MGSNVTLNGELLYPSKYLKAADLKGKDVTVTISVIEKEMLPVRGGKKEEKTVVTMEKASKQWVMNPTNADSIAQMYGTEAGAWIGKRVTLYPTRVQFGRNQVDAIRVREKVPAQAAKSEPTQIYDDIPFDEVTV